MQEIIGTVASTPTVKSSDPRGQNPTLQFFFDQCGAPNLLVVKTNIQRLVALRKQLTLCRPVIILGTLELDADTNTAYLIPSKITPI